MDTPRRHPGRKDGMLKGPNLEHAATGVCSLLRPSWQLPHPTLTRASPARGKRVQAPGDDACSLEPGSTGTLGPGSGS